MLSRHTQTNRTEERYRSLIVATAQLVWMTDAQGNVVEDIPTWRAFTGQTRDEVKGQGWINALHPEDRGPTASVWAHAVKTRSHYATEYRLRRYDGEYFHFMVRGVPILEKNGCIREWVGACTNITEWKHAEAVLRREQTERLQFEISNRERMEQHLREGRQELDEAQRLAMVGSWVWELEPDRVTWSEEMCDIFGHDSKRPAPCFQEHQRFFTSNSWEQLSAAVERALQSGTPYQLDLEIVRASGERAWIIARGEARRDTDGRIVRLRGTVQDITGRKQSEEELQWRTAFFEAVVHGCFDGMLVVDSRGKKILQNQRMLELWDLPSDIVADPDDEKQVQFVVTQRVKYPDKFFAKVNHLYSNPNEVSRDEVELKSGMVLDRYSSPVIDTKGKYYGRIWSFRDITKRKRAEEALKAAHDTLEQRVQERTAELRFANEQLARTNRLLRILSACNERLVHARDESELLRDICRIIVEPGGYPSVWIGYAEDDQAKTVRLVAQEGFDPGYVERNKVTWADDLSGRGPMGSAIRSGNPSVVRDIQTSDNFAPWREEATRRGYASVIGLPLRGHGRVFGGLTIYAQTLDAFPGSEVAVLMELADDLAYGITAMRTREEIQRLNKDLEKRVRERTAELMTANQELETFNYSVSHDLRAPLRAVDAFCHLLQEEYSTQLNGDARDYLSRISAATGRMEQLIKGLLNLSQINRAAIHSRPVSLSAMAEAVAAELQAADAQREVRFTITPNLQAEGDPGLLRSVLQNLIGNSWKYTSKHKNAHIGFGGEEIGGETVFHVSDDGAGFNPENAGRLFNAFRRLHRAEEFPGTGIGLAIVQRILERHGGRVWAKGNVEHGATFYFTIPKAK